jgi:hypothetical protein
MHGLIFETSVWLLAESTRLLTMSLPTSQLRPGYCQDFTRLQVGWTIPTSAVQVLPVATFALCRDNQSRSSHTWHFQLPVRPCSSLNHPKNTQLMAGSQAANSFGQAVARSPVLHPCGKFAITTDGITRQLDCNSLLRIAKEQTNILWQDYRINPRWVAISPNLKPRVNISLLWLLHRHNLSTAPLNAATSYELVEDTLQAAWSLTTRELLYLCFLNNTPDLVSKLNHLVGVAFPIWTLTRNA